VASSAGTEYRALPGETASGDCLIEVVRSRQAVEWSILSQGVQAMRSLPGRPLASNEEEPMSRVFGPLRQMGFVVRDIDAAMRQRAP